MNWGPPEHDVRMVTTPQLSQYRITAATASTGTATAAPTDWALWARDPTLDSSNTRKYALMGKWLRARRLPLQDGTKISMPLVK